MTLATLPAPLALVPFSGAIPTGNMSTAVGSDSTFTMNAAGDKLAFVFQSPGATVPDLVSFVVASVSVAGTAGDIECTLETLATDGTPSGTPVTNSNTATVTASTTGVKNASGMAGTATVSQGTAYAIVLTAGAGWDRTLTLRIVTGASQGSLSLPYALTKDTAGSWVKNAGQNLGWCIGLANSGGTYIHIPGIMGAYSSAGLQSFSDATNPDERGNRFSIAGPATIIGAVIAYSGGSTPGANDDFYVSLYSSHTGTPNQLVTKLFDGDAQPANMPHICLFGSSVDLSADTVYALAFKAAGSDSASVVRWDYQANADLAGHLGAGFYSTTRDGGTGAPGNPGNAFTDDSAKVYAIYPLFSRIDDGTGGGGNTYSRGRLVNP